MISYNPPSYFFNISLPAIQFTVYTSLDGEIIGYFNVRFISYIKRQHFVVGEGDLFLEGIMLRGILVSLNVLNLSYGKLSFC